MNSMRLYALPIIGFMFLALLEFGFGQGMAPSPEPEGPSNDGKTIDQGIAYILLMLALAITYLFH
ncbi:ARABINOGALACTAN PROTEIN 20 [Salix purpurea]|uniref:ARABINOGALACTAN PROTEIN 20 n=1 Tax=Salix purpurea TaxID=77065 RepID=A0A9Q0UKD8_SALPP|nr:ARABINOGALACTAN PROTEIN 20 [Salix purpurea]